MRNIAVTGATGFIGKEVCLALLAKGYRVRAICRIPDTTLLAEDVEVISVGDFGSQTDWSRALSGVDCIIHCAGRADSMRGSRREAMAEYRKIEVLGTRHLAESAAAAGVDRLVFLSSIKVNAEQSTLGEPLLFSDQPAPTGCYGVSKWEAEQALWEVVDRTELDLVVVRPPLVYGPGVKGNLRHLLCSVSRGLWLPLGSVCNKRSLMGLANLVDLLINCVENPAAIGQTFLASDGEDISTSQLIRLICEGMNRPVRLLPVPVSFLRAGALSLGRRSEIDRLIGSLQVDSEYTQNQLAWRPPMPLKDGIVEMARWYANLKDVRV